MGTFTDSELAYWLGVLFSARKRGDAKRLEEALEALARGGVQITFAGTEGSGKDRVRAASDR